MSLGGSASGPWADEFVGHRLNRGQLAVEAVLARGGMSIVCRAAEPAVARTVAVKIRKPNAPKERFYAEAITTGNAKHRNVIELYHVHRSDSPSEPDYMVMELLNAGDLQTELQLRSPIAWPRLRPLALQLCDGLSAVHKAGIVHRDVKPENCGLYRHEDGELEIKLLDFGIAKYDHTSIRSQTCHQDLLGTRTYMAPEQFRDPAGVGPRADIYALGVTLFVCLTREYPREEPPRKRAVELSEWGTGAFPRELQEIIRKATQPQPESRYASMAEVHAALAAVPEAPPFGRQDTGRPARELARAHAPKKPLADPRPRVRRPRGAHLHSMTWGALAGALAYGLLFASGKLDWGTVPPTQAPVTATSPPQVTKNAEPVEPSPQTLSDAVQTKPIEVATPPPADSSQKSAADQNNAAPCLAGACPETPQAKSTSATPRSPATKKPVSRSTKGKKNRRKKPKKAVTNTGQKKQTTPWQTPSGHVSTPSLDPHAYVRRNRRTIASGCRHHHPRSSTQTDPLHFVARIDPTTQLIRGLSPQSALPSGGFARCVLNSLRDRLVGQRTQLKTPSVAITF